MQQKAQRANPDTDDSIDTKVTIARDFYDTSRAPVRKSRSSPKKDFDLGKAKLQVIPLERRRIVMRGQTSSSGIS